MNPKHKKILIDICHPAEVHHFRFLYEELSREGWQFLFAAKDKDVTRELLQAFQMPFIIFSVSGHGIGRKLLQLPLELLKFARIVRHFRPSFIVSNLSLHSSWISAFSRAVHIAFVDTEHRRLLDYLTVPFAHVIMTPDSYTRCLGRRHYRYSGNHELAYLHPSRRRLDPKIHEPLGLDPAEPYVLLRFVAWRAFHDIGLTAPSDELKVQLVRQLEKECKVFISAEDELPAELEKYRLPTPPHLVHSVLQHAYLYIGEGASMASEAACLGTPAVYINALSTGYCEEECRHHLLIYKKSLAESDFFHYLGLGKGEETEEYLRHFLKGKIDVTAMMAWFFRGYPSSITAMERGKRKGVWINGSSPCRD